MRTFVWSRSLILNVDLDMQLWTLLKFKDKRLIPLLKLPLQGMTTTGYLIGIKCILRSAENKDKCLIPRSRDAQQQQQVVILGNVFRNKKVGCKSQYKSLFWRKKKTTKTPLILVLTVLFLVLEVLRFYFPLNFWLQNTWNILSTALTLFSEIF